MFKFSDQTSDKVGKEFYHLANEFFPYAQEQLGFKKPVSCVLVSDPENSSNPLGYTAHYAPSNATVTIYADGRHVKDMLRSFSHELVHHAQACRGDLDDTSAEEGYAQNDDHMREMEREACEKGNLIFRDWEDGFKKGLTENDTDMDFHNVTYYTAQKMDVGAEAHHAADVEGHNQAWDLNNRGTNAPYESKYRISDNLLNEIISSINLDNISETKEKWIGTAFKGDFEKTYFWTEKNKLFYLVEFSSTYGVDVQNVFDTKYRVNSAGLRKLKKHAQNSHVLTYRDKRR